MESSRKKEYLKKLTFVAVMTAIAVICSLNFPLGLTFRIGSELKFSPVFIAVAVTANIYGFKEAGFVAAVSDLIQGLCFGSIMPLITVVNLLIGIVFGLFLKNNCKVINITLSVLITQIIGSFVLISISLHLWYGIPYVPMLYFRALQTGITIIAEIIILLILFKAIKLPEKLKKILK